jgi:hypothetical protein
MGRKRILLRTLEFADANIFGIQRILAWHQREVDHHPRSQAHQGFGIAHRKRHDHSIHVAGNRLAGHNQSLMRHVDVDNQTSRRISLRGPSLARPEQTRCESKQNQQCPVFSHSRIIP